MKFDEYIPEAIRTENIDMASIRTRMADDSVIRMLHAAMGIATESGELSMAIDGIIGPDHVAQGMVNFYEEVGDVFWYIAVMYDSLQMKFGDIAVRITTWDESWANGDKNVVGNDTITVHGALLVYSSNLVDILKKHIFYGKPLDGRKILIELHNVYKIIRGWMEWVDPHRNKTFGEILSDNILKLKKRHGDKFNPIGVLEQNRDIAKELSHIK